MMVTTGGRGSLLALRVLDVRQQRVFGVAGIGVHGRVAEFLDHQHRGVVVDGLGDGRHHAHLEQRLDHVAALERELLREVGHGDGVADRDFAHDRRGRAGEAMRAGRCATGRLAARLRACRARWCVRRARSAALRCSWPAKRAASSSSSTPATIACEPRLRLVLVRGGLVVDARRRPASGGHGGRPCGLRGFLGDGGFGGGGRGGRGAAFALGGFVFQALALGRSSALALGVGLGQALLLGQVALARFLELAQDLGALGRCAAALGAGDVGLAVGLT